MLTKHVAATATSAAAAARVKSRVCRRSRSPHSRAEFLAAVQPRLAQLAAGAAQRRGCTAGPAGGRGRHCNARSCVRVNAAEMPAETAPSHATAALRRQNRAALTSTLAGTSAAAQQFATEDSGGRCQMRISRAARTRQMTHLPSPARKAVPQSSVTREAAQPSTHALRTFLAQPPDGDARQLAAHDGRGGASPWLQRATRLVCALRAQRGSAAAREA